ncbi:MAG: phage tail protein [Planctomycetota bacterium]|nr:MAG: phage tail protein [Planctomycetota bacterium]
MGSKPGYPESYRANEFYLKIDGIPSPAFTKVSGLSDGETGTIEQIDPKTNEVHKISSGVVKFEPLTLERNLDGTPEDKLLYEWFQEVFKISDAEKDQGSSTTRRNGSIHKLHFGKEVMAWTIREAWIKSSKYTDLEAGSENMMKLTIVLEHEGLERIKP